MDCVPANYFEVRPDTLQYVRKLYNLDKPGVLEEAVSILDEWVQKQTHFNKKDFSRRFLETTIIICKGSIERAKQQLDRMCTLRTLWPKFFGKFNAKKDFLHLHDVILSFMLPKLTDDHYRVYIGKYYDVEWESSQAIHYHRQNIITAEYVKAHDYLSGVIMIFDLSESDYMNHMIRTNIVELKQALTIFTEGYGMRIKAIHIISSSKVLDSLVGFIKLVLSAKIAGRVNFHKSVEELQNFIPKAILPKDYGGDERSLRSLHESWINLISSEENLNYLEDMHAATTNESYRSKDQLYENYAGMPGTFRYFGVD